MTGHETFAVWLSHDWGWLIFWFWILGGFGAIGERRRRRIAEQRQHELDLEKIRASQPPPYTWQGPVSRPRPRPAIPAPSARTEPGPCPHVKLVPVVNKDGDILRFTCGNPLCSAVFPPDTVIYEPGPGE